MRYPRQNTTVKRRLRYPPSNDDFSPLFCDTLLLTTAVQPMKTLSSLSIVVVSYALGFTEVSVSLFPKDQVQTIEFWVLLTLMVLSLLLKGGTLRIWSYLYNKGQLQLKEAMKLLFLVIMLAFLSQPDYTSSEIYITCVPHHAVALLLVAIMLMDICPLWPFRTSNLLSVVNEMCLTRGKKILR
uniref:Transmembrane protein n=1 Tax=Cucumis melo TaxID=3656 RepID=A0A9I9E4M4_CUCME